MISDIPYIDEMRYEQKVSFETQSRDISKWVQDSGVAIDLTFMRRMMELESGGRAEAVSPTGATGLFQFTEGTWGDMVNKYGEEHGISFVMRGDARANTIMAARLAEDNRAYLENQIKQPVEDYMLYMAHNIGARGAKNLLNADPSVKVTTSLLGSNPIRNPKFFRGTKNVGEALERYRQEFSD